MIVVAHRYVLLRKSNKFDQHGLSQENHNAQSQTIWVDPNPLGVISRSNHKFDFRFFDLWKSHRSFIRSLEHFHLESSAHLLYHPEKNDWQTSTGGSVGRVQHHITLPPSSCGLHSLYSLLVANLPGKFRSTLSRPKKDKAPNKTQGRGVVSKRKWWGMQNVLIINVYIYIININPLSMCKMNMNQLCTHQAQFFLKHNQE